MTDIQSEHSMKLTIRKTVWAVVFIIVAFISVFYYDISWKLQYTEKLSVYTAMLKQYVWELNNSHIKEISHVLFSSGELCGISVVDDYGNVLFRDEDCYARLSKTDRSLIAFGLAEIDKASVEVVYGDMNIGNITFYTVDKRKAVATAILMGFFVLYLLLSRYLNDIYMKQKLEYVNVELSTTLDTLQKTVEELESTRSELIRQEKFQSLARLMAQIAHDVNTPLGVAYTSVSELAKELQELKRRYNEDSLDEEHFQEFLDIAQQLIDLLSRNVERAYNLIRSFKRITSYEVSEEKIAFDVIELVHDIIRSFGKKFEKAGVDIVVKGDDIEVYSYPGAIVRILTNLLENSLMHGFDNTQDDKQIIIDIWVDDGTLTIDYRDNGKGIDKSIVDKVFEPFFTTKKGEFTTGLGLSIIYNLVTTTLGGTVFIDENYKDGFRIVISFPIEEVK